MQFPPWMGKTPWRRKGQPTPVILPGESHGQRNLAVYSPQGCKESDMIEAADHGKAPWGQTQAKPPSEGEMWKENFLLPARLASSLSLMCAWGHLGPCSLGQAGPDECTQPTHRTMRNVFVVLNHYVLWWFLMWQKLTNTAPLIKLLFYPEFCPQGSLWKNYEVRKICLWRYQPPTLEP